MTITIVADVLGAENNGTTIACMNLVRYLRSRGDTVRVLCADQDKKGQKDTFVCPNLNLGFVINHMLKKNEVTLAKADKKVIDEALDGADVCHVMIPFALGKAAMKAAKKKGIPVTAGFHCQAENFTSHLLMINFKLANKIFYHVIYDSFYKKVDAIHYPSQFIRDYFEKTVKRTTPGVVVSNGVNSIFKRMPTEKPEEFRDKFVILFTGRISREKSHNVLVRAVAKSKYKDNIQLVFAGSGPRKWQVNRCVKKSKITPPVINFFSREDLVKMINCADLYCHPAEIEIEAISCLEAISCGLVPVISDSPRSATKAFALDENNLFKFNDSADLAKKIDFWIEHPELKKEYSDRYLGFTEQYDQAVCMEKTRKIIEDAYGR